MVPKAPMEPLPELVEFLAPYTDLFVRSEGREDLERYTTGLLSDLDRKNAQRMGEALPGTNGQRLQELLTSIQWDEEVLNARRVRQMREVGVGDGVLLIDDTAFPKKGSASVGVARQYCGVLGKVANCQVAVTSLYADPAVGWPVGCRLYLPEAWLEDPARCRRAGVPEEVSFQTKGQLGLSLVDQARAQQVPFEAVVSDAGYGEDTTFLAGLEARHQPYLVQVPSNFRVAVPIPSPQEGVKAYTLWRADALMQAQPRSAWRTICWREGSKGRLRRKFLALRVDRVVKGKRVHAGWLVGERPARGQQGEWKYYFSTLPEDTPLEKLVDYAHRRWRIEQFHEDGKNLLGWDHYQGRLWRGFHRHAALVMLAYTFLVGQEWQQRSQRRSPGRPRDPFSPSARPTAAFSGAGPPADPPAVVGENP